MIKQKKRIIKQFIFLGFFILMLVNCSIQTLAVRSTAGILANGFEALNEENDLVFAEQAIPANLKQLEALIKSDPNNKKLLLMAAEGYTGYALGFVEDVSPERASRFYLRARDFALTVLNRDKNFQKSFDQDIIKFQEAVDKLKKTDISALFWSANAWGSYVNLNKTDINALADLPKIDVMMKHVLKLDQTFYYGGPHLFLGTILASRPRMLGGNPQKAKEHFETCLSINRNAFLMAKYFYAKTYAVQVQDRKLFEKLLGEILTAPEDILPEQRLANAIAKKKAKMLLEKAGDLFF